MFGIKDFGIDLGTENLRIYIPGSGIQKEPSIAAFSREDDQVAGIGSKALYYLEKDPERFAKFALKEKGEIHDYATVKAALNFLIQQKQFLSFLLHPDLLMGLPHGITTIERKAIRDLCVQAGFSDKGMYFIDELMAAAIGADLPVLDPVGSMIVNIGAGNTQAAVIALGGMVSSDYVRMGGHDMDQIIDYIRRQYGVMIGEATAEKLKMQIGSVLPGDLGTMNYMKIEGRSIKTGMPETLSIRTEELHEAIQPAVDAIVNCIFKVLENLTPDVSSDLLERGILLTGGGSLMKGMDVLLHEKTHLKVQIAENAMEAVILGIQKVVDHPEAWSSVYSGLLR